jgi:5'-nucleotidase
MPFDLSRLLVIGVSSRALFDLEWEARMFDRLGRESFREHQLASEDETLRPGTAFPLVKGLLALNNGAPERAVEVIVVSRNDPDIGLRVTKSIQAHGLDISRMAYIGNEPIVPYLEAYKVDLFLSCEDKDVLEAVDANISAAALYRPPNKPQTEIAELRIAFDADAVLFSDESEHIYRTQGLDEFLRHEAENADKVLAEGPLARLLIRLGALQKARGKGNTPIKLAVVTARNSPAHERVIKTLRAWGVAIDSAFFLGGVAKAEVLKAFGAHIYFDDQEMHLAPSAPDIPCALVPYRSDSKLRRIAEPEAKRSLTNAASDGA